MKFKISHSDYWDLFIKISTSLSNAIKNTAQHEPQLVANMLWHLTRELKDFPSNGLTIQTGGVFVHQKPQVKCADFPENDPSSVEIGDLLLLRTEKVNNVVSSRSAFLLQAKKFIDLPTALDNKNQHHLYAKWPPFEYVRSSPKLNAKKRRVTGPDLYNATKYLLIGKATRHCPGKLCCNFCCEMGVLTAQPSLPAISQYRCFVLELADFILGDAGKPFHSPPPKKTRNWDRVIEDLTNVTAKTTSAYISRASSNKSSSRGQVCFFSGHCADEDSVLRSMGLQDWTQDGSNEPPQVPSRNDDNNSQEGGISIIEFMVSTEQGKRET